MTYQLPPSVEETLATVGDAMDEMFMEGHGKDGFTSGLHWGLNFGLTTITEMAHEDYAPGSREQKAILAVGQELFECISDLMEAYK